MVKSNGEPEFTANWCSYPLHLNLRSNCTCVCVCVCVCMCVLTLYDFECLCFHWTSTSCATTRVTIRMSTISACMASWPLCLACILACSTLQKYPKHTVNSHQENQYHSHNHNHLTNKLSRAFLTINHLE